MKLYDVLHNFVYFNKCDIYKTNDYGQYIHICSGTIDEARRDADYTFDYLMSEIEVLEVRNNKLLILVHYDERAEELYSPEQVARWKYNDKKTRPYRTYTEMIREIDDE